MPGVDVTLKGPTTAALASVSRKRMRFGRGRKIRGPQKFTVNK
jgi:hypothetical protein